MPTAALPVPYAEPRQAKTSAIVAPPKPRAGAHGGHWLSAAETRLGGEAGGGARALKTAGGDPACAGGDGGGGGEREVELLSTGG